MSILNRTFTFTELFSSKISFAEGGDISQLKPAYLMTLDEYQSNVTPIIKDFQKFIRKNAAYLQKEDYHGFKYITWKEILEKIGKFYTEPTEEHKWYKDISKKDRDKFIEEDTLRKKSYWEQHTGKAPDINVPQEVLDTYNDYQSKFEIIFGDNIRRIEGDETKSNKRSVRRAIDDDVYKKMLEEGSITIEELNKIASSVGVTLPKRVFSESTIKQNERDALYKKIYDSMPSVNKEVLTRMVEDIKISFKPLEDEIYEKEMARYERLIEKFLKQDEIKAVDLSDAISFHGAIFKIGEKIVKDEVVEEFSKYYGLRKKDVKVTYYKNLTLKDGYKKVLDEVIKDYIQALRAQLIYTIIQKFQKITLPIKKYEMIELKKGPKGFEGEFYFEFINGSHFIFKTQGIGAGGYNIQVFHYRYISDFTDVVLADESKGNRFDFISNFSAK